MCCFKCVPDVQPSSEIIRPYLEHQQQHSSRKPAIVLIQNGVDIEAEPYEQLVRASVPLASGILSAVSWITASLVAQGSRVEHGNLERLSVGVYTPPDAQEDAALLQAAHTFVDVAARGGADASVSTDIEAQRWQKLLWNVSWGALSLLSRRPTQELVQVETLPYSMGVVRGFMEEMVSVARASGISEERLPTSSIDKTLRITLSSTPARVRLQKEPEVFLERDSAAYGSRDFRPSILVDLESQRPMELEPIFMNVLRRARRLHVDTPRLDVVAAAIKPAQLQLVRERNGEDHNALIMAEGVYDLDPQDNYTAGARLAL